MRNAGDVSTKGTVLGNEVALDLCLAVNGIGCATFGNKVVFVFLRKRSQRCDFR